MDLRVILSIIVATGVYALLLKCLQKNSQNNVQANGGGGVKGFLNNVKKNALFLHDGFPYVVNFSEGILTKVRKRLSRQLSTK